MFGNSTILTLILTKRNNVAAKYPEKLKELQALFDEQAKKNNIYPFIDWEDVLKGRIHHDGNHQTFEQSVEKLSKPEKQINNKYSSTFWRMGIYI